MYLFYPPFAPLVNIGALFALATTSNREAVRIIGFSQSQHDGRAERISMRFWSTVELLHHPDGEPSYSDMLRYRLIVQEYVEAYFFEVTNRAAITYRANRDQFYKHRAELRTLENQLKICRLDAKLIRERVDACLRKD